MFIKFSWILAAWLLTGAVTLGAGFRFQTGDLLFQDLDCGPLCEAIEKVTQGVDGARFSHVGMVIRHGKREWVLESMGPGVREVPLSEFLARSHDSQGRPKVLVGRLVPEVRAWIPRAVHEARSLIGAPYDDRFLPDNAAWYCSELIREVFLRAGASPDDFPMAPMTFRDPITGRTMDVWSDYFDHLGVPVPEGEPGCNPGGLSRSRRIRIVHASGQPDGWHPGSRVPKAPNSSDSSATGR